MKSRIFTDQNVTPNDTLLGKYLGGNMNLYMKILETSSGLNKRWQYINGNGWLLKVDNNEKTVYYVIACEDGIIINLTVRDIEMDSFRQNEELDSVHNELNHAKRYSGGYAISFEIKDIETSISVAKFLKLHINDRISKQEKRPVYHKAKPPVKKLQQIIK